MTLQGFFVNIKLLHLPQRQGQHSYVGRLNIKRRSVDWLRLAHAAAQRIAKPAGDYLLFTMPTHCRAKSTNPPIMAARSTEVDGPTKLSHFWSVLEWLPQMVVKKLKIGLIYPHILGLESYQPILGQTRVTMSIVWIHYLCHNKK